MARQSKKSIDADAVRALVRRTLIWTVLLIGVLAGCAFGFNRLRQHVARIAVPDSVPKLVMANRPRWMNDRLADQILRSVQPRQPRSALDQDLLKEIASTLAANPWVKRVTEVRRVYGQSAGDTIEVTCDYRAPMALVSVPKSTRAGRPKNIREYLASVREYIMVDAEGYRLPQTFPGPDAPKIMFADDGVVNLRIIDGVAVEAPQKPGQKWAGDDLKAGLEMAGFLYGRDIAQDIYRIHVGNFAGRENPREAQLVLLTKFNSEIRWGEPLRQDFYAELNPTEKLRRLQSIRNQYGRIDAKHSWLDIRFEDVLYPKEEAPVASAGTH